MRILTNFEGKMLVSDQ